MNRSYILGGSALLILLFLSIMGTGAFLKKPLTENDDVIGQVQLVEQFTKEKKWKKASEHLDKGFYAWEKVKNRIQFGVERNFIEDIDMELATIKGSIVAEDQKNVLIAAERLKIIWGELGK